MVKPYNAYKSIEKFRKTRNDLILPPVMGYGVAKSRFFWSILILYEVVNFKHGENVTTREPERPYPDK